MKDVNAFIADLAQTPLTRRPQSLSRVFLSWLVVACVYVALLVIMMWHPRPDLFDKMMQPLFLFEILSLTFMTVASAFSASLLSFPDYCQKKYLAYAPLLAAALFIVSIVMEFVADNPPAPAPAHAMECCGAITIAALPLAAWMFMRIRKMAPTQPRLAGACSVLAAFGASALALRLSEQTDSVRHLILWHYAPMAVMGLVGLWLGRRLLKW